MTLNFNIGIALLLFTGLLGWSRIVLRRHTLKEVLTGGGLGLIIGLIMLYTEGYL
jgi:membrane-associated phospholipid phosphatase